MADTLLLRSQLMHDLFWESFPDHPALSYFKKKQESQFESFFIYVCMCVCVCVYLHLKISYSERHGYLI